VKILRQLDIDGKLGIAQLKAQNLRMQDLSVDIKAQNGLIGLKPLKLSMYGGQVETSVVVDVKFSTPKYGIDESVTAVQVGDLLKDYSGEERISGTFSTVRSTVSISAIPSIARRRRFEASSRPRKRSSRPTFHR
jgi:AsmA protein